jgi:hypothetical protein
LRAAVVGGGAYAVGRSSANKAASQAQQDDDQNARIDSLEQQQAPPQQAPPQQAYAPPEPAPAAGPSLLDQLNQLDALHQQGALTDNEFTAAKAKLLGS